MRMESEGCGQCGVSHGPYDMCQSRPEPEVKQWVTDHDRKYGAPGCPSCGYKCSCCCHCSCQTSCDEDCEADCHEDHVITLKKDHQPWDCCEWRTRFDWAKSKQATT